MNLRQLIDTARLRAGDDASGYLWSDEEWTEFANDAENQACRRARLIVDSTTTEITEIALSVGTATYDLDQRVIFIRRAKLDGRSTPLRPASFKDLDECRPDWQDETGEPECYVVDMDTDTFRPYPTPSVAGTVNLTVVRTPLEPMAADEAEPEIKPRYHLSLVDWMLYRAYSKKDSERFDAKKAKDHFDDFEREFGRPSTAVEELWINQQHGFTPDEGVY